MPYPLPTEHERRALFAWLKQASSLTAWRRLYSHHQAFVDTVQSVYEEEEKTPGMAETIGTNWFTAILESHDAFAQALRRLERGDRRCFTFLGAPGHFSQGLLNVEWWQNMYYGSFVGRNGFPPADSPRWPEIERVMHHCLAALSDIGVVLQDRLTDVPAPISRMSSYRSNPASSLIKLLLAAPSLPAVPTAEKEVLVRTGKVIPDFGIWEPVQVGAGPRGIPLPPPTPVDGRNLDGCLNYLHAGYEAPTIAFPEDSIRREGRPTTWRLVWRDERYGKNAIAPEEDAYVFVRPVPGEVLFKYGGVPGAS
jgi:hypothetical protein